MVCGVDRLNAVVGPSHVGSYLDMCLETVLRSMVSVEASFWSWYQLFSLPLFFP